MQNLDRLVLLLSDGQEQILTLFKPVLSVGRGEQCDLVMRDAKVSRQHAQLRQDEQGWLLTDNSSVNGTFVNGKQIATVRLQPGDLVRFGSSTLRFELSPDKQASSPEHGTTMFEASPADMNLTEIPGQMVVDKEEDGDQQPSSSTVSPPPADTPAPPPPTDLQAAGSAAKATARPRKRRERRPRKRFNTNMMHSFLEDLQNMPLPTPRMQASFTLAADAPNVYLPRLVIITPDNTWQVPLTSQDNWIIGRDPRSDIWIDHNKVSRQHARVERQGSQFIIRDLQSANGVWCKRERISEHMLNATDSVSVGPAQIIFKPGGTADDRLRAPEVRRAVRQPVVIIPGTMGSELWRGPERIWPNVRNLLINPHLLSLPDEQPLEPRGLVGEVVFIPKLLKMEQYNRLGDYLEETLHYKRGQDLLEFAYDWRKDMRVEAQQLADTIERWGVDSQVTIIAHSQGCLVARYFIDQLGGDKKVGRLVLVGGPNYGAPNSIMQILPAALSHLLSSGISIGGSIGQKLRDVFGTFPALYSFLPAASHPTVVDQHGAFIDLYADARWLPAAKRPLLEMARDFRSKLNPYASVPTVCIFGYGHKTIVRTDIERDSAGVWQSLQFHSENDGDGTVPSACAVLEGADIHPVQQDHNSLYVDEDVMMRLKFELTRQGAA